jgi:hypothetical protein
MWVNPHVLFVLSAVTRLGAAFLALRVEEPGTRPVCSLGELVSLVGRRALAVPAPTLAEPHSASAES